MYVCVWVELKQKKRKNTGDRVTWRDYAWRSIAIRCWCVATTNYRDASSAVSERTWAAAELARRAIHMSWCPMVSEVFPSNLLSGSTRHTPKWTLDWAACSARTTIRPMVMRRTPRRYCGVRSRRVPIASTLCWTYFFDCCSCSTIAVAARVRLWRRAIWTGPRECSWAFGAIPMAALRWTPDAPDRSFWTAFRRCCPLTCANCAHPRRQAVWPSCRVRDPSSCRTSDIVHAHLVDGSDRAPASTDRPTARAPFAALQACLPTGRLRPISCTSPDHLFREGCHLWPPWPHSRSCSRGERSVCHCHWCRWWVAPPLLLLHSKSDCMTTTTGWYSYSWPSLRRNCQSRRGRVRSPSRWSWATYPRSQSADGRRLAAVSEASWADAGHGGRCGAGWTDRAVFRTLASGWRPPLIDWLFARRWWSARMAAAVGGGCTWWEGLRSAAMRQSSQCDGTAAAAAGSWWAKQGKYCSGEPSRMRRLGGIAVEIVAIHWRESDSVGRLHWRLANSRSCAWRTAGHGRRRATGGRR